MMMMDVVTFIVVVVVVRNVAGFRGAAAAHRCLSNALLHRR